RCLHRPDQRGSAGTRKYHHWLRRNAGPVPPTPDGAPLWATAGEITSHKIPRWRPPTTSTSCRRDSSGLTRATLVPWVFELFEDFAGFSFWRGAGSEFVSADIDRHVA